jgi:Fasciclin domain
MVHSSSPFATRCHPSQVLMDFTDLEMDLTDPMAAITVCVPPNEEVAKLVTLLSPDSTSGVTPSDVGDIIALHIATGKVLAADFLKMPEGTVIPTIGGNLTVYHADGNVTLGTGAVNVTVTKPNQPACAENSVIHELSGVLTPPGSVITPELLAATVPATLNPDGSVAAPASAGTRGIVAPAPAPGASSTVGLLAAPVAAVALVAAVFAM